MYQYTRSFSAVPPLRRVNLRMRFILNLPFLNIQLVHIFRIPPPIDSGGISLCAQGPISLRKRGGILGLMRKGERFMVSYLLEKGEEISHLGRQIMKVPGYQGLSMNEFFDDIFKSKRKYCYALP